MKSPHLHQVYRIIQKTRVSFLPWLDENECVYRYAYLGVAGPGGSFLEIGHLSIVCCSLYDENTIIDKNTLSATEGST